MVIEAQKLKGMVDAEEDDYLILKIREENDIDAWIILFDKYLPLVKFKANRYFIPRSDIADLIQEGLVGIIKAVRDFDTEKGAYFKTFAALCIERQMITAVKTARRNKHLALNDSISLNSLATTDNNPDGDLWEMLSDPKALDPLEQVIAHEKLVFTFRNLAIKLSPLEAKIYYLYIDELSYEEIAAELGITAKKVDNALQRLKKKLECILNAWNGN